MCSSTSTAASSDTGARPLDPWNSAAPRRHHAPHGLAHLALVAQSGLHAADVALVHDLAADNLEHIRRPELGVEAGQIAFAAQDARARHVDSKRGKQALPLGLIERFTA